jgi:hypothetical protein
MAGMKGRSGGHNNRTLQEHLDRGTFRRDRHGHLSAQTTIPRAPAPVPENVVQGLQAPGKALVEAAMTDYTNWTRLELTLLRQAARCLDDAEAARRPRESGNRLSGRLRRCLGSSGSNLCSRRRCPTRSSNTLTVPRNGRAF